MTRDNFQALFANNVHVVTKTDNSNDLEESPPPPPSVATSNVNAEHNTQQADLGIDNDCNPSSSTTNLVNCENTTSQTLQSSTSPRVTESTDTAQENTKPGTESLAYLKRRFLSPALQNIRELKLSQKMNALADNLEEYPDRIHRALENNRDNIVANRRSSREMSTGAATESESSFVMVQVTSQRKQSDEAMEEECRKIKLQSEQMCREIGRGYDALTKFVDDNPHGSYEDFIQYFHLQQNDGNDDGSIQHGNFMQESFYAGDSHYRKLWNDNLTLGLDGECTTLEGRAFVAARDLQSFHTQHSDELDNLAPSRTGDRIKQLSQIDRQKIASSAFSVLSNVSSLAMKPIRDLQLAEKVNAMQLDIEEEETRREIERYNLRQAEKRDLEDMMRLKKEAEERTLKLTKDHLVEFLEKKPGATYTEWIEDLHPENAHDGALLEGFGKTIDHRFFVEESDHRRIWNDHLTDPNSKFFVPPRPKQMNENGELVVASDLLSGSEHYVSNNEQATAAAAEIAFHVEESPTRKGNTDLITFD
ncbi:hypothetical protein ACHAXN_006809 [Cyclotella atomus]